MDKNDIVEYPLLVLGKLGIFSKTKTVKVTFMTVLYITAALFLEITSVMQFWYIEGDITEFAFNSEAVGAYGQVAGKIFFTLQQQNNFIKLADTTKSFWKTSRCSDSVKIKLDNISARILQLQRIFFACTAACAVLTNMSMLLGRPLALGVWKIEGQEVLYNMVMGSQIVFLPFMAVFLGAFDCLFLAFCIKGVIQFRILSYSLKEISNKSDRVKMEYHDELKVYIQYHVFLLSFLEVLRNTYSFILLVQYGTSSSLICVDMYALLENSDVTLQVRQGIIVLTQVLQLAFYCIAADYVTNEAVEISDAIFHSSWYLQNSMRSTTLRTTVTVAIQKSQKQINFTVAGLIKFNSRALLTVLQASWSVCTVLRRIKTIS